jgi:hypothetical protein
MEDPGGADAISFGSPCKLRRVMIAVRRPPKRVGDHNEKFWFKYPIVSNAAYVEITDENLRHQIEQILIGFLKSNAVINKYSVVRN